MFVAVGDYGTILTSVDGKDWQSAASIPSAWDYGVIYGVTFGNGIFVAVGDLAPIRFSALPAAGGTPRGVLFSTDGTNWTSGSNGAYSVYSVTFGNGLFVAVGEGGTILTSPDSGSWSLVSSGTTGPLDRVAYRNGIFLRGLEHYLHLTME